MRALNRPTSWWGWHWEPTVPMSIIELIEAGNLDARLAGLFWLVMEHGASLVIAADPPSSGKTTTLSALMSFTHPDTAVYFTCGEGEDFRLPPVSSVYDTYILVNEMSDHIPVYTWDDNARRVFQLLSEGYRLGTTMHANTTLEILQQLEGQLSIPGSHVAHLTFVVPMYIGRREGDGIIRRVQEVTLLQQNGSAYKLVTVAEWAQDNDTFTLFDAPGAAAALAGWAGMPETDLVAAIDERAAFLEDLRERGIREIPVVSEAIVERMGFSGTAATEG
ncbi:MAG: hypothetical protein ABIU97_05440 [Dehalococcoidia bacterium]